MPAPLSQDEADRRRKAIDAAKATGTHAPYTAAAKALGNVKAGSLVQWDRSYQGPDPAIAAAMEAVGTRMVPALAGAKTKPDDDGNSFSVLLKPQAGSGPDLIDRLANAFAGIGLEAFDLQAMRYRGIMERAWADCVDEEIAT